MLPVICVIDDPYATIQPEGAGLVVETAAEFSQARQVIEAIKQGQLPTQLPWQVVVQREVYLAGFQDLLAWDRSLVIFQNVSPRAVVETALGTKLPADITNERLLSWGIRSESDVPPHLDLDQGLEQILDKALENVSESSIWSQSAMAQAQWLNDWFCHLLTGDTKRICSDAYLVQVARKRMDHWLAAQSDHSRSELAELLFEAMSKGNGGQAARQLAARSLLRNYEAAHIRLLVMNLPTDVGGWIKHKLSAEAKSALHHSTEQLYASGWLDPLVRDLDTLVSHEMEELNPESDLDKQIEGMSGFLPSEYRTAVYRLSTSLVRGFGSLPFDLKSYRASLDLIASKFAPLLANKTIATEDYQAWLRDLLDLARALDGLRKVQPTGLDQWWQACTALMRCEGLLHVLRKTCPRSLAEILDQFEKAFAERSGALNDEYADWLLVQFPQFLEQPDRVRLITQATWLAYEASGQVILLIVDGLRWDWWRRLAERLAERGYQVEPDGSMGLAMLPTVTHISRRAAVGRFPLSELVNFVDDVYGIDVDPDEEARLAARVLGYADDLYHIKPLENKRIRYLSKKYVYVNGTIEDMQQALRLPAQTYVIVYPSIDKAAHTESEEDILQDAITRRLTQLADALVGEVERNHHFDLNNLRLIVTADHGCAHTRWSRQQPLPPAFKTGLESPPQIERHGRVAQLVVPQGSQEAETIQAQVRRFCQENAGEWHVIWGEDAAKYGLPAHDKKGNHVIAWFSPRHMNYLAKGSGLYVHGGFSLYETLVPLALLRYSKGRKFVPPAVTLVGLDKLRKETPTTVLISVSNYNRQELTGSLSISTLQVEGVEIEAVPPNETVSTAVEVTPTKSGEVVLSITLRYRVGLSEEMKWTKQVTVDVGMSRREQMQLETKRELF